MLPTFSKITLPRLWLFLALLSSVLTSSGQASSSTFLRATGTWSGLVVPEYAAGKKAISYQRAVSLKHKSLFLLFCFCHSQPIQTLFRQHQLGSVRFKFITRLYLRFKAQIHSLFLKIFLYYPEQQVLTALV